MNPWKKARTTASHQHGAISRPQMIRCEIGIGAIDEALSKERLLPLHAGVYAFAGTFRTYRRDVMAAHLAAGPASAAREFTAATMMRVLDRRGTVELLVPYACNPTEDGFSVKRSRVPFTTITIENIPITSPVRTLEDLVPRLSDAQLDEAFDSMWRKGFARPSDFVASKKRRLRELAAESARDQGPAGSVKESEVKRLLRTHGFPRPVAQFRIVHNGRFVADVDLGYPEQRIVLEYEGFDDHSSRRALERDRARLNRIFAAGYVPVFFTRATLADPEPTLTDLRRLLERCE